MKECPVPFGPCQQCREYNERTPWCPECGRHANLECECDPPSDAPDIWGGDR